MRDLQFCLANFYHRTLFSLTLQHIEQTISLLCFATVGISSPWLMLMLVSDSSIIREEVMSPGRSYSSRYFVEYIPFPLFSPSSRPLLRAKSYVQLFLGTLSRYSKNQCTHRSDVLITDRPHQTQIPNAVVVPPWKKELAEKRKQRSPVTGNQASGKENEPSTFSELPLWQREIAERRKRREFLPGQELPEKTDNSTERPEWQRRLKNTRRNQPIVAPKGPSEDSAESVPSFMKEFEKKKRTCPRGKYFCQVETNYNQL